MKKYWMIIYQGIIQMFTYRLSFILWRLRNVFNLMFVYFLWTSVFANRSTLLSYTYKNMITYIVLINIFSSLILSTRTTDVANDILSGDIANYLLKPFSFFKFLISKEISDKLMNFGFSILEIFLLLVIFKPVVFIQVNPLNYAFVIIALCISFLVSFYSSLALSFLAFWLNDTWAPRFIYFMLVTMLAGTFFPLDILPKPLYDLLLFTPFPYFIYFPSSLFIHGFTLDSVRLFGIGIIWCFLLYGMMNYVWTKGIKNYSAYGR